jgi:hypothetical protein
VRNRILRRYGLAHMLGWPFRLVGISFRRFTRTGFLEQIYEKHLYGDTSLFQLPESPSLHLLTTNVSEGRLCSFHREGLSTIRPLPGNTFRVDRVSTGLATVGMAVAASSAFPGFFPPLVLTGEDVDANKGEFGRAVFSDGGVFDNLGIRMFRFFERFLGKDKLPWDAVLVSGARTRLDFELAPTLYAQPVDTAGDGEKLVRFEIGADFQKVPSGESVDLIYEHCSPGLFLRSGIESTTLSFDIEVETIELTRWLLLPLGREYKNFQLIRYETGKPETTEKVNITTEYLAKDYTILAFKLLSLKPGFTYELTWYYR